MVWSEQTEDDRYNSLILHAKINWRQVFVFRAYSSYLKQIKFPLEASFIVNTMLMYPKLTTKLAVLFDRKFNPKLQGHLFEFETIEKEIEHDLQIIEDNTKEKAIRIIHNLIKATKRTNFYQLEDNGGHKSYLSFKIASTELKETPLPKPLVEIFVYSVKFYGLHLRGGRIARGGIRWSDRSEDLRTEILGLMKAQMTKNAVIAPVGSKGGFYLKNMTIENGREQFFNEGKRSYQLLLAGLLDLTDNIVNDQIYPPTDLVRYDGDDTYLVVAADKGTASFSDIANYTAKQYNFWLGDAFASGGSAGYDHKKLGITARGVWISVENHFNNIGIDINKTTFTMVGIGDMSGDVFGNGLILYDKAKLIAAFDHRHIFLDPMPDPQISLQERKRIFSLPQSQWCDYDPNIISEGGGVFSRSQKNITLSLQIKSALCIPREILTLRPEELISAILKAPVDLLWNGGIGTYVKASSEINDNIGDKTNDNLRINGTDLRCKVIGEGGNLGLSQLGRIEYAGKGGNINTDFIDNSAGVDCSDHEVNIKICLNDLMKKGQLSLNERNAILEEMSDEICQQVLEDNRQQAILLTLETYNGHTNLQDHIWLIKYLTDLGLLNSEIEFLPNNKELSDLVANGGSLSRPEISVLTAYSKNTIHMSLNALNLLKNYNENHKNIHLDFESGLLNVLINYFPKKMQKSYKQDIFQHKLRNEIIATSSANAIVNSLGCTFFHRLINGGESAERIVQAFYIIKEVFCIDEIWQMLKDHKYLYSQKQKLDNMVEVQKHFQACIELLLYNNIALSSSKGILNIYKQHLPSIFPAHKKQSKLDYLFDILRSGLKALSIIHIKEQCSQDIASISEAYFSIELEMDFEWMKRKANEVVTQDYVDRLALKRLSLELETLQVKLTKHFLSLNSDPKQTISAKLRAKPEMPNYKNFITTLKTHQGNNLVSTLVLIIENAKRLMKINAD
jgi:glutamate dehydrogenase